jgi:hypothetical protein
MQALASNHRRQNSEQQGNCDTTDDLTRTALATLAGDPACAQRHSRRQLPAQTPPYPPAGGLSIFWILCPRKPVASVALSFHIQTSLLTLPAPDA